MPNWVYNNVSISGTKEDLVAFEEKARKLAPTGFSETGELEYKDENAQELSFWNFIEPEDKALYFGASDYKPEGYAEWSMEERMNYSMKFQSDGWYDWNVREWGTKWDACNVSTDHFWDSKTPHLKYYFETAWSIPEPVFTAMVRQHPELDFDFSCEEEQGWGAEYTSSDGDDVDEDGKTTKSLILTREWDIPQSHADYTALGRECYCEQDDDEDNWYEDCPRPETEFVVVVERRYIIKTRDAETAWTIAQEDPEQLTEVEDEQALVVVYDQTSKRLYPTFESKSLTEVA